MTQPSTVQMPAAQSAPLTLTPAGRERLENRLEHLRSVRRQEVADTLAQVRGEGDISENPLFDQTIFEGLRLEHEIEDLEERLARAVVGVQRTECGVAAVGDRVVLELVLEGKPPEDAPPARRWAPRWPSTPTQPPAT